MKNDSANPRYNALMKCQLGTTLVAGRLPDLASVKMGSSSNVPTHRRALYTLSL